MARKFGLEVEFGGSISDAVDAIRNAGLSDRTARSSYMGHADDQWVIKTDASVSSGGEMVSPPLDFDDPEARAQVTTAVNAIRVAGCSTIEQAGIHVHIDASDLTAEQVAKVVRTFTKFEDVIYRIASSGWNTMRRGSYQYAPPLSNERARALANATTFEALGAAWYGSARDYQYYGQQHGHQSRYAGINLHSYFYRKTIEFRIFNSSLNPERIQGYIAMCVALVEDARRNNKRSITKAYKLGAMVSGEVKEANAFHRFQQVLRYEAGMELEDMKRLTRIWKDSKAQPATFFGRE